MADLVNIVTIDVEEWFHGHNYLELVPPGLWEAQELRVVANTERCLELLARRRINATFFVLGWTAERFPELVQQIVAAGHEIGCHSYAHPVLYRLTETEFRDDLGRALTALHAAGVERVAGYRAPSFTLT
ncbi:MAG: polysaccharide deacetylase family protein, partial [bacterium]